MLKLFTNKRLLSFSIFLSILTVIVLTYCFIEILIPHETICVLLICVVVFQILFLQYFFKNQLKSDIQKKNIKQQLKDLKAIKEEAVKELEENTIYLENVNYELRTPLNTVLGMLKMLKKTDVDLEQMAQVEIAEYSSQHLLQLINVIDDNVDVYSGNIKLNNELINLKADFIHVFKVFEYQALEKQLEFDYKFILDDNIKFSLMGDLLRIQQVLINLINNAIKYTEEGKISVIIDQSVTIDATQIVTFYVKDTGVGMSPESLKHFLNNSDINASKKNTAFRGGGLGLTISKQLVKLMGGELKVESKQNEGTTFYFGLELKKTLNVKSTEDLFIPVLLGKCNVLVAEDNRMNQKVIKFLLEQQGADCTFAKNGLEAVELYKVLEFDMVFMDIYMPDMDGYDATKAIKQTAKYQKKNTPIIGVSASAFKDDLEKAKQSGIEDFLAKPIEVEKLKMLLLKHLKD
ncbi:hypothetical protein AW14_11400 [Siansivirga zeaxanthinifaciens CC-SAMT-1]|uniref:histidine kinase n=1 Tax=Siansivirga zeaxanthinifaciens CC-SAMT-1 TaxID=1454006 RepID=A0A0C5WFF8_9FLAO|nr:hypothetical protein AW14_11400 [Siansivirga zeaxanthinifaciens CC-SAMT-1]